MCEIFYQPHSPERRLRFRESQSPIVANTYAILNPRYRASSHGYADRMALPTIAIIADQLTPYRVHVMARLSREISEAAFVHFLTHRMFDPSYPGGLAPPPGVEVIHDANLALSYGQVRGPHCARLFERIRGTLIKRNVKLVILNGYNDATRVSLIRWAREAGVPLLLAGDSNIHSDDHRPAWKRFVKRMVLPRIFRDCAGVMPMGAAGEAYFRRYGAADKPSFRFPYEPDYAALQQRDQTAVQSFNAKHTLAPARRRFLAVARLAREKRHDLLLDAFERVATALAEWYLLIVGDGPLRGEVNARIARLPNNRVVLIPPMRWEELVHAYHACDAFVHAAEDEPWGVVINEAIAARLPVIATTACGAAIELVRDGHNGRLVPPGNAAVLADAMTQLADDESRAAMRSKCDEALRHWREAADPVDGVRRAISHFLRQ